MAHSTISNCHSLTLYPLDRVTRFCRYGCEVRMSATRTFVPVGEIPGTLKVSVSSTDGILKKNIRFELADVSVQRVSGLRLNCFHHFVATYVDESGNVRVSGSPDWPLTLEFTVGEGCISCTLSGEDTETDAFLIG